MRIVIIGAVAAGTSAATAARRNDKNAEIVIYEKSKYISYAGCGMPYLISKEFEDFNELVPRNPQYFKNKQNVDILIEHEVLSVNAAEKTLTVKNIVTGEIIEDSYDKLVISTGASSAKPDLKGSDRNNVFALRNIDDMIKINEFISVNAPKTAAIVGSGFIGLEMCESFKNLGMDVTIIARSSISKGLDKDMSALIEEHLKEKGVKVFTGTATNEITDFGVLLGDGSIVPADIVLLATGIVPNVELAKNMGVELGVTGAIKVDKHMKTNLEDVYSCGDCIEEYNTITGKAMYRPLGSTANKTGTIAGNNITDIKDEFRGVLGTGIYRIFDLSVGQTGFSEEEALKQGFDAAVSVDTKESKPEYMGGKTITVKAVADKKTDQIIGAQIIGYEGVDKRLDVLATLITYKGKPEDLMHMDLSYSPPYSTARDPLYYTGAKLNARLNK